MSNKTVTMLLGIVAVLALLLAARHYVPAFFKKPSLYLEQTKNVSVDGVSSIGITAGNDSFALSKKDGTWKTEDGIKADRQQISALLSAFLPLTSAAPELIAQTDARYSEFGLDDRSAVSVTLNEKLTLLTGKNSGSGMYVRFKDAPHVYILKNTQPVLVNVSDWYERTVVEIPRADVKKLSFSGSVATVLSKQDDGSWTDENGKKADSNAMDLLVSNLESLFATALITTKDAPSYLPRPDLTLTIEYKDTTETLMFYNQTDNYIVERGSDKQKFTLANYTASVFTDASATLFPTPTIKL